MPTRALVVFAVLSAGALAPAQGGGPTWYLDESAFIAALTGMGYTPQVESFEDDSVWGVTRNPSTALSVTSQGITWQSNHAAGAIKTSTGPAYSGSWGFYSSPHGSYATGTGCTVPGACNDGWVGTSATTLVAISARMANNTGGDGELSIILDGNPARTVDFGGATIGYGGKFFGVIDFNGFLSFEFRETEGTIGDIEYIFGDHFVFARTTASTWSYLGEGIPGDPGWPPYFTGTGTLAAGSTLDLDMDTAAAAAPTFLVVGLTPAYLPFATGFIVPSQDVILPLTTTSQGKLHLSVTWPPGIPTGTSFYLHTWVIDAYAPMGIAASNAILGVTP